MQMLILCDRCAKIFSPGNRPDGIPNGVTFVQDNGKPITLCADCLIKQGAMVRKHNNEGGTHDE